MKKVYLVRNYTFFKSDGKEYQCANCGEIPMAFTSKAKAEKYFYKIAKEHGINNTEIQLFPFMHFEYNFITRNVMTLQEVEVY